MCPGTPGTPTSVDPVYTNEGLAKLSRNDFVDSKQSNDQKNNSVNSYQVFLFTLSILIDKGKYTKSIVLYGHILTPLSYIQIFRHQITIIELLMTKTFVY